MVIAVKSIFDFSIFRSFYFFLAPNRALEIFLLLRFSLIVFKASEAI